MWFLNKNGCRDSFVIVIFEFRKCIHRVRHLIAGHRGRKRKARVTNWILNFNSARRAVGMPRAKSKIIAGLCADDKKLYKFDKYRYLTGGFAVSLSYFGFVVALIGFINFWYRFSVSLFGGAARQKTERAEKTFIIPLQWRRLNARVFSVNWCIVISY